MSFPESILLSREQIITPTKTQRAPLGARGVTVDGRVYRYARAGAANLQKGYVMQTAVPSCWSGATLSYLATGYLNSTSAVYLGSTSMSSTWSYLVLTCTKDSDLTVTADYFKEGYLWVSGSVTEGGQMVSIKTHAAAASGVTTGLKVYFADDSRFSEVVDTASFISMQKNEYDGVVVAPVTQTGIIKGIPNCDVTAEYYFWLQTWGPCPVKASTAASHNFMDAYNSTVTEGTVDSATATTCIGSTSAEKALAIIGKMMSGGSTGASIFNLVHLTLAP